MKAACMSDVASADDLRGLIERYATFLSDLIHRPDEPWQSGLPNIPTTNGAIGNGERALEVHADGLPADWDSRFATFLGILASTTKVALPKILPETYLAALGIDSITAVQIVAKARREGLRLSAAEVVQSRTVGDLLMRIKDVKSPAPKETATTDIDVPRTLWSKLVSSSLVDQIERITHASPGMEWMVGMWQRSKGSRFQHVFGYRVAPEVDILKLRQAWDELLRRHALLRSTFAYDAEVGQPRVIIFKPEALSASWTSEGIEDGKDPLAIVEQRMKDLVSHPPPIDRPITRAVFLRSPQASYLLLHLHHFQYDAWSLQLLVDDLSRLCTGLEPRSSNDLDAFLRFVSSSTQAEGELSKYWQTAISPSSTLFPPLSRKTSSPGRDVYTNHAAITGAAKLDQRARELAVSLQSVFLACWAQVQASRAKAGDPVFSLWHSGRTGDLQDIERLAIPCINVLPFSVPGAQVKDSLTLARQIQDDLQARSAAVEQSRLAKVHEWVSRGANPLSNVFVNIVKIAPELEKTQQAPLQSLDVCFPSSFHMFSPLSYL